VGWDNPKGRYRGHIVVVDVVVVGAGILVALGLRLVVTRRLVGVAGMELGEEWETRNWDRRSENPHQGIPGRGMESDVQVEWR